jgi:hypothetical protein
MDVEPDIFDFLTALAGYKIKFDMFIRFLYFQYELRFVQGMKCSQALGDAGIYFGKQIP